MKLLLASNASGIMLQEGQFNQFGRGLTVYIRSRGPNDELEGIIIHDRRNRDKTKTIVAERGAFIKSAKGPPKVVAFNFTQEEYSRITQRGSFLISDPPFAMELKDDPDDEEERVRDPTERPMRDLFSATEAQEGVIPFRQLRVEGHTRLAAPLYHFAYALVAAACLLCGGFNRRGQGDRLILAVFLMIVIQAAALGANSLALHDLMWVPLIYITPIVPALAGVWALLRPSLSRPSMAPAKITSLPVAG
jgi:lipopolysaccharide export system permease protein